jgi:hypothetical protein
MGWARLLGDFDGGVMVRAGLDTDCPWGLGLRIYEASHALCVSFHAAATLGF